MYPTETLFRSKGIDYELEVDFLQKICNREILMGTTVMATSNAVVVPVVVGPACIDENANCGHWAYVTDICS